MYDNLKLAKPKPAVLVKRPIGKVVLRGEIKVNQPNGEKKIVHQESQESNIKAEGSFPSNCPMVAASVGLTLSAAGTYNSIRADAYVLLPVAGFTKELVIKTQERAFALAEDKLVEKTAGLQELLKTL